MKTPLIHILSFGDISKVCIKFARHLDANRGCTGQFAFVSAALLSGSLAHCLSGSSTPVGQTDDDDDSHQGCSSLPPVHPTVGARGAGAQNGEQRERSERRGGTDRGSERLVDTNSTLYRISRLTRVMLGKYQGQEDTANPGVDVLSDILIQKKVQLQRDANMGLKTLAIFENASIYSLQSTDIRIHSQRRSFTMATMLIV